MKVALIASASGSGKTTTGRAIAERLGIPFHGLDALHHGPGWAEPTAEELRTKVEPIVQSEVWVIHGTYRGKIGDIVPAAADVVVWLDLPVRTWHAPQLPTHAPDARGRARALSGRPPANVRRGGSLPKRSVSVRAKAVAQT